MNSYVSYRSHFKKSIKLSIYYICRKKKTFVANFLGIAPIILVAVKPSITSIMISIIIKSISLSVEKEKTVMYITGIHNCFLLVISILFLILSPQFSFFVMFSAKCHITFVRSQYELFSFSHQSLNYQTIKAYIKPPQLLPRNRKSPLCKKEFCDFCVVEF